MASKDEEVKAEEVKAEATEEMKVDAEGEQVAEETAEAPAETDKEAPAETNNDENEETKEEPEEQKEAEEPKELEKPKEQEIDSVDDSRPKATGVDLNLSDATLNCMPTQGNKVLMTLTDSGFQYLLAGVRANVGLKTGRYMFEAQILESHRGDRNENQQQGNQQHTPLRNLLRIGVSTAGSSLLLGDGTGDSMSFDSEGFMVHERNRKKVSCKFGRGSVIAVLVNMDASSPNANTISLFKDGVRISEPQPIPEKMQGKALIPTITYKNVSVQVNFGPTPLIPLPFKCHMLAEAASADVEMVAKPVASDKFEVLFPVGLPDAGYFDWVDAFLEKNPDYQELSDRKIVEWAVKSGLQRPKLSTSTDKPDMKFANAGLDDLSVKKLLHSIAPTARRNFIIPEMKQNLSAADRALVLKKFSSPDFKKTATVIMGEPSSEHKSKVQDLLLTQKKRKADSEKRRKAAEEERTKLLEIRKKKADEARKAREAASKKKADGATAEEGKEEESKAEETEPAKVEEEEAVIELTAEEKALWFRKKNEPDMTETLVAKLYTTFSLPTMDEGFDSINFDWQSETESTKIMRDWIFQRKLTQRVEDIAPGAEFKESWSAWTKSLQEWRKAHSEWKDPARRKAMLAKRAETKKKEAEEKGEEAPKDMEIDMEDLDVHNVDDIKDVGTGEPLFANFTYEDWTLLSSRFELHLLLHHFKKDLNDSDRPSFTEKDLAFYYNKYFKKTFTLKTYGLKELAEFIELVCDALKVNEKTNFLEALLPEDTKVEQFVKLAEEHRRDRQRRLDAGDETAELKFPRNAPAPPTGAPRQQEKGSQQPWSNNKDSRAGANTRGAAPHQSRHHGTAGGNSTGGSYHSRQQSYSTQSQGQGQKRAYSGGSAGGSYQSSSKHQRSSYGR